MNTLKLEKRGMDFNAADERVSGSDVGNYRVTTPTYSVPAKDGKVYFLEFMRGDKREIRRTNKRTGKPLSRPVMEVVAPSCTFLNAYYVDGDGCCWGDTSLWNLAYNEPRPFTMAGILDIVNSFAAQPYESIEFVGR